MLDYVRLLLHFSFILILYTEDASWPIIWPIVQKEVGFGRVVLTSLASSFDLEDTTPLASRLNEIQVAELYIWLARQYPYSEDPKHKDSISYKITARDEIARFRDNLLSNLRGRGTPAAIQAFDRISNELPDLYWLNWTKLQAKMQLHRNAWIPLTPAQLRKLVTPKGSRLVQSADELQQVIIESLYRLDHKLQGETPAAPQLWDEVKPKNENHLSNCIKLHLEEDLKHSGIIALREVEIRQKQGEGASGERTDIHVTGVVEEAGGVYRNVRVIVEVKGCWNKDLKEAMKSQLVDRYLKDNACQHGLYIVGWFVCDQWKKDDQRRKNTPKWKLDEARGFFSNQSTRLSVDGLRIKSFVLNTALR